MPAHVELFNKHQYLNLETYRKNGEAVRTPVWFAQEDAALYIWTSAQSGKVKRIRRNPHVKVAPSDQAGKPLGEFVGAEALLAPFGTPTFQHGQSLIDKKYGLLKKLIVLFSRAKDSDRVVIKVQLS